ncbi:hypothetical protein JZU71_00465, partial [bacterium]|nr:hypothetical protein [bacterium]
REAGSAEPASRILDCNETLFPENDSNRLISDGKVQRRAFRLLCPVHLRVPMGGQAMSYTHCEITDIVYLNLKIIDG